MTNIQNNIDTLRYYCFDWDDNILNMPTMIHLEHRVNNIWIKVEITTSQFSEIRHSIQKYNDGDLSSDWRYNNNSAFESFYESHDCGTRGANAFVEDTIKAIENKAFGPVWEKFISCLITGNQFLIITARGHEPSTLKNGVSWIIYNILSNNDKIKMINNLRNWNALFDVDDSTWDDDMQIKHYLNESHFVGVDSEWFKNKYNIKGVIISPEKYKAMAIREFVEKISAFGEIVNKKVSVGFSDDDISTVKSIYKYFEDELSFDFPIEYNTFHSRNDGTVKKKKTN